MKKNRSKKRLKSYTKLDKKYKNAINKVGDTQCFIS